MKKFLLICILFSLISCKHSPKHPDLSHIQVDLKTMHFEAAFFNLDTNHLENAFNTLNDSFPGFSKDYLFNILGTTVDSAFKER